MIFGGRESKSESYSVYCAWMHVYTNHGCPFTRNNLFWKLLHRSHRSPSPYRMMMLLLFLFLFSVSSSVKVFGFEDDEHTNTHTASGYFYPRTMPFHILFTENFVYLNLWVQFCIWMPVRLCLCSNSRDAVHSMKIRSSKLRVFVDIYGKRSGVKGGGGTREVCSNK